MLHSRAPRGPFLRLEYRHQLIPSRSISDLKKQVSQLLSMLSFYLKKHVGHSKSGRIVIALMSQRESDTVKDRLQYIKAKTGLFVHLKKILNSLRLRHLIPGTSQYCRCLTANILVPLRKTHVTYLHILGLVPLSSNNQLFTISCQLSST